VDYRNTPEGVLVQRAQGGDESAFREIVERYQSKVFSIIYGTVRQRNDVEDLAQQVLAKVCQSLRGFDFRSSLITWIYRITVNECFDYLRTRKVSRLVYESELSEDELRHVQNSQPAKDRSAPVDVSLAQRDYALKLLMQVSGSERMLLFLKEVEGYSVEELAERTGLKENTIKVRLFRARQKLIKAAQRLNAMPALVSPVRNEQVATGSG